MIDKTEGLPVVKQCELLDVARSTVCYQPRPERGSDTDLMRRIDEIHLRFPFLGSRRIVDVGTSVGWGGVFGDQAVAAAMIDRIVHHADVLALKGASYRLRDRGIDTLPSIRAEQDQG